MSNRLKQLDISLPVNVTDLALRTTLQYAKISLADCLIFLHGLTLYEPVQPHIINRLQDGALTLLCCHRKFGKSTMAEDLAFQELTFKENSFVIFFGKSDEAAEDRISSVKRYYEMEKLPNGMDNPFVQLKPQRGLGTSWTKDDFTLINGNRCKGSGQGAVLGIKEGDMRPSLIIIDDPVDPESITDDKKMINWFRKTIIPLGDENTRIIMIGTPRRFTDIIMTYLRDKDTLFEILYYPAIYDDGTIMCPEFWTRRGSCCRDIGNPKFKCHGLEGDDLIDMHIAQQKKKSKSQAWATEFLLKPIDDATSLFPMKILDRSKLDGELDEFGIQRAEWTFEISRQNAHAYNQYFKEKGIMPPRPRCVIGVDLAIGENPDEGDYTVMVVLSCDDNKPYRILDGIRTRGESWEEKKRLLWGLYHLYRPEWIVAEDNGFQVVYGQEMLEIQDKIPIVGHTTHSEKHTESIGIPSMKALFINQSIETPYGDTESQKFIDDMFYELHGFNKSDGKVVSITENDDMGVALWMAIMAANEVLNSAIVVYKGFSIGGPTRIE